MLLADKVVVVTGGGRGIGAALADQAAGAGARAVVVADIDLTVARATAQRVGLNGTAVEAVRADVGSPADLDELARRTREMFGSVDVFFSNAGIAAGAGVDATARQWARAWSINVMSHVHAARIVLPSMLERDSGAFVITASAAGLLNIPGDAPYAVTKGAAVALAEWLALTHGGRGVQISVLCPLGVRTDMLVDALNAGHETARAVVASGPVLEADVVARCAIEGVAEGRFLIMPQAQTATAYAEKAADPEGWLVRHRRATAVPAS
ncbi:MULTISPECIES: SDR family oxidoreductase [Frankia]|uniref:Oxidoreductase n=1 Tax=Frankia alni (strain DSM 45986 / CECT 9034 / ACN14a) TaxID=326424 RepID=Q0RLP5_FRAAA|nr:MULTISPECIES: SDR family NAD(P)-dependent oxidoreductase [Frankia]CAJ61559.1 putative oxidoreductase [Frankia alni ACN14a]